MSPETLQLYNTLLAILTVVSLAGAVGLTAYRLVKGPDAAALLEGVALWIAWLVALVSTTGSLIYSEYFNFIPCQLCWFQRIAMYPMSVILLVGALRREAAVKYYALPLSLGGALISIWHYLIQLYPGLQGSACDPANPCTSRWVETFGFISIPFMAGVGFILISVLLAFYVKNTHE